MSRAEAASAAIRRRPFGVYAIAGLLLLNAAVLTASEVAFSTVWKVALPARGSLNIPWLDHISAVLLVIVAVGLIGLRRWAWVATMVVIGIGLATGIWLYFNVPISAPDLQSGAVFGEANYRYVTMALNVIVVFYLNQRSVQVAFEPRGRGVH